MMNKILILLLVMLFLSSCSKQIEKEEAISIAQEFVNSQVVFYTADSNSSNVTNVNRASIKLVEAVLHNNQWNIFLLVQSSVDEEIKERGLLVVIDAETGDIVKDKVRPFDVDQDNN